MFSPVSVVGVRHDGTRRIMVSGLTNDEAEEIVPIVVCDAVFKDVLIEPDAADVKPEIANLGGEDETLLHRFPARLIAAQAWSGDGFPAHGIG